MGGSWCVCVTVWECMCVSVGVCVSVSVWVCVYPYLCGCVGMCLILCVWVGPCMCVCECISLCECAGVCVSVCLCELVRVCVSVYLYVTQRGRTHTERRGMTLVLEWHFVYQDVPSPTTLTLARGQSHERLFWWSRTTSKNPHAIKFTEFLKNPQYHQESKIIQKNPHEPPKFPMKAIGISPCKTIPIIPKFGILIKRQEFPANTVKVTIYFSTSL